MHQLRSGSAVPGADFCDAAASPIGPSNGALTATIWRIPEDSGVRVLMIELLRDS